jgi:hypothetical protein
VFAGTVGVELVEVEVVEVEVVEVEVVGVELLEVAAVEARVVDDDTALRGDADERGSTAVPMTVLTRASRMARRGRARLTARRARAMPPASRLSPAARRLDVSRPAVGRPRNRRAQQVGSAAA